MKRRTTPVLRVNVKFDNAQIETIEFLFKQIRDEEAATKLLKTYPTNVTYDSTTKLYSIPFTAANTVLFESGKEFFMDTRITTKSNTIPATEIVALYMHDTLFDEEEVEEEVDD